MPEHRKFRDLAAHADPQRRARIEAEVREIVDDLAAADAELAAGRTRPAGEAFDELDDTLPPAA